MITHIAIFKWKASMGKSEVNKALKDVAMLKTKIPGIMDIRCGENFSKYSKGFTHAVVVTTKNKNALHAYRTHPDHKIIAAKIDKMEEDSIGVDFED